MEKREQRWCLPRHRVLRKLLYFPIWALTHLYYPVKIEKCRDGGQALILFNHQTALDQFLVSLAFPRPVYYVASEDLFSVGPLARAMEYAVAPIPIKKQATDIRAVKTCLRVAKEGGTIALAPEGRHLFPYLTVQKNLILGATQRRDKDGIAADMEFVFGLFPILKDRLKQKAGTLSGGQQQMLAIARALMANPKLLCLDEPSLGLAPVVIDDIGEKIREINKTKGTSILLVEQNVHLAFGTAQYCYTLQVGNVVAEGTTEEIRSNDVVKKAYFGG